MGKNYLIDSNEDSIKKYSKTSSYLPIDEMDFSPKNYFLLPEEYDIFSDLNSDEINERLKMNYPLAIKLLSSFKMHLQNIFNHKGILCVLPKLLLNIEENTITFNLINSNFRIFFSFESLVTGGMAYCGLVIQEDETSMMTQTKLLNETNCDHIVETVLRIMFENL